ncbi:MAG: SH3 domain-containing protein [Sphingomonas sp.]|nr:SH3 domain-containing protein [Sphingomonas sp.]MDX3882966.1 SH3 domain-containing protein [Sphingomonas sp.]
MRKWMRAAVAGFMVAAALGASAAEAQRRQVPYWVSIAAREALMRTGPGTNYPATWKYVRPGLPLRVIQVHEDWRRVEDPEGERGWVKGILLSEQRTAIVVGQTGELHAKADGGSRLEWRVAPGVIGKVDKCGGGWCRLDVKGRRGYIETRSLWGVAQDEAVD